MAPQLYCLVFLLSSTAVKLCNASTTWCVARSDASDQALQAALDYACGSDIADCTPIGANGLCYLPNTIQAHASYAYNSYYQRRGMAPGSCDFSATATVAKTDPSYGSCVYPSSLRFAVFANANSTSYEICGTAGGMSNPSSTPTSTSSNTNVPTTTPTIYGGGNSGLTPLTNPPIPTTDNSNARSGYLDFTGLIMVLLSIVFSFSQVQMLIL